MTLGEQQRARSCAWIGRGVFAALCVLAAVLGARGGEAAPPPAATSASVIYPEARVPLVFSHAAHLGRDPVLTCAGCHAAATTSRSVLDVLLPGEAACRACHPIDRAEPAREVAGAPPARCEACHVGWTEGAPPARMHVPAAELKFDHAAHAAAGVGCESCHAGVGGDGEAEGAWAHLPTMASCLACHDGAAADDACATCHLSALGVLRTELASGVLAPRGATFGDAHDLAFAIDHARAARRGDATCDACHRESFCVECHAGTVKPVEFHPGDYVLTHAVDARRGRPDCSTCHRQQTFCVACHERSGVGMRAERAFDGDGEAGRFHPAGWASSAVGGANEHARQARASLDTCASCHREDDCLACHSAELGAPRVSPHGRGWRGSARCEALAARNARMCLRCHTDPAEQGCDWLAP